MRRHVMVLIFACLAFVASAAGAAEIHVVSSGGFAAALKALAPAYEQATSGKLVLGFGPSMGETHDAVPARLQRGEDIDVVTWSVMRWGSSPMRARSCPGRASTSRGR